jgi:hypothetical protein
MPLSEWKNFAEARPIARIGLNWVRVQGRVHQTFYVPEGTDLEVLLLRLASGAEVAFVAPGPRGRNVDVLIRDPRLEPKEIISEVLEGTDLDPEQITLLA